MNANYKQLSFDNVVCVVGAGGIDRRKDRNYLIVFAKLLPNRFLMTESGKGAAFYEACGWDFWDITLTQNSSNGWTST